MIAPMSPFDLDRIGGRRALDALVSEVLACGEVALQMYAGGAAARASRKLDKSPVTEADEAVEAKLRAFLASRFPDAGFFGEESGKRDESASLRFVVDPIDGTRAFIRGIPTWSILVALEADGEPVVGIAYMPAADDLFVGVRGDGAYHNGRPLRVSRIERLDSAMVCHGALAQFTVDGLGEALVRLGEGVDTCRGFADFDGYRQLLLGRADAMVDPDVKPYDVGPAAVLVREAGGRFTDLTGAETIHGRGALASNGILHDALVALVGA